ncbi:hypothetical protein T190607A01A_40390 [Tenacibaculum sp. 190524A05c]|uniref:Uncharacterized protein n=1 Tax=Tenacibaculum platacis TaxID=3137852 RepID=A0ABM9P577_9FLAO
MRKSNNIDSFRNKKRRKFDEYNVKKKYLEKSYLITCQVEKQLYICKRF